jgi:RNA polymerase sigma-70 factor (ECF subfamily)
VGEQAGSDESGQGDEDAGLMLAFQGGDVGAFDRLYRRHGGPLLRHLERIVRQRAIAEELLQETFLRVHRARDRYQPQARFSTWIYTIATNLALNELRRPRHARPHRSSDEPNGEDALLSRATDLPGSEEIAHTRRIGVAVGAALAAIPERQREALWRAAVDGQSYAEVAVALETSEKSVKALVHRARVTLAERLPVGLRDGPHGRTAR